MVLLHLTFFFLTKHILPILCSIIIRCFGTGEVAHCEDTSCQDSWPEVIPRTHAVDFHVHTHRLRKDCVFSWQKDSCGMALLVLLAQRPDWKGPGAGGSESERAPCQAELKGRWRGLSEGSRWKTLRTNHVPHVRSVFRLRILPSPFLHTCLYPVVPLTGRSTFVSDPRVYVRWLGTEERASLPSTL